MKRGFSSVKILLPPPPPLPIIITITIRGITALIDRCPDTGTWGLCLLGLISLLWIIKLDPFTVCAVEAFWDFFESQNYLFKTMAFSRVQTIQVVLVYECLEKYPCNLENVNLNRVWKTPKTKHVSHNNLSPILPNQLAHFFFHIYFIFLCYISIVVKP